MEWLVLLVVAALVAAFIAWPRRGDATTTTAEVEDLRAEVETVLHELREVDEDVLAGRITAADRAHARRALLPRVRRATEALRDLGEEVHTPTDPPSEHA